MVRVAQEKGRRVIQRMRMVILGAVQGVGFRPFVYRLASEMNLPGWVRNSPQGVFLEIEGEKAALDEFLLRLPLEKPPLASIQSLEYSLLDPARFKGFEIRESETSGSADALILPDIAVCGDCLSEMNDPGNRRYRYPFINCAHCGPRFTIIESLPYDRMNTSMKTFPMCPDCRREYENPLDRRFHAQPTACPVCGPELELWDAEGRTFARGDAALRQTAGFIRDGNIVAVKGLGGFHLMTDARNTEAVEKLRLRKHREEKPFARMYPSLDAVKADCRVSPLESRLLLSPESPIVLLEHTLARDGSSVSKNPYMGVMLPYTPLHHLLMEAVGGPVIATSGNLSDEPLCIDEREALTRLSGIADFFLAHNRPILRHVDDSIVRIVMGRELVLRRARGYAPLPIHLTGIGSGTLAVGGHLKNTIALTSGDNIFISQHIGDLANREAGEAFRRTIADFRKLYRTDPVRIAADTHPDYLSTKAAGDFGIPVIPVQHHYAHAAACGAENELDGTALGVTWDGAGYGLDGTIWGGEFLVCDFKADDPGFKRVAAFRKFRLPGSESAVREPRRAALGVLNELGYDFTTTGTSRADRKLDAVSWMDLPAIRAFPDAELSVLAQMLAKGINSPWTTSAGRLFDAVSSLAGLRQKINFEGQAAMELEFAAFRESTEESYPFDIVSAACEMGQEILIVDWAPMIRAIIEDVRTSGSPAGIAKKFHNALAEIILAVARRIGQERVMLTGGCFQNKILLESAVNKLRAAGFRPYWPQRVPPNDGGIALGQAVVVIRNS